MPDRYISSRHPVREAHLFPNPAAFDEALLRQYQPVLLMHPSDTPPISFADILGHSVLKRYRRDGSREVISPHPRLKDLEHFNAPEYFLDFEPEVLNRKLRQGHLQPVIYGKTIETSQFKALYYFYYFPFSSTASLLRKKAAHLLPQPEGKLLAPVVHQGDAEGVQVLLRKPDLKPVGLFAFQHYAGQSLPWLQVQTIQGRPVIQLERGSHASIPLKRTTDHADNLKVLSPRLEMIQPDNRLIMDWRGRIGKFPDSRVLNRFKEVLPSVTAGYRGPVAREVTPWEVSLALNAAEYPEAAFFRYLPQGAR